MDKVTNAKANIVISNRGRNSDEDIQKVASSTSAGLPLLPAHDLSLQMVEEAKLMQEEDERFRRKQEVGGCMLSSLP